MELNSATQLFITRIVFAELTHKLQAGFRCRIIVPRKCKFDVDCCVSQRFRHMPASPAGQRCNQLLSFFNPTVINCQLSKRDSRERIIRESFKQIVQDLFCFLV